jgi:hypothetical protein
MNVWMVMRRQVKSIAIARAYSAAPTLYIGRRVQVHTNTGLIRRNHYIGRGAGRVVVKKDTASILNNLSVVGDGSTFSMSFLLCCRSNAALPHD